MKRIVKSNKFKDDIYDLDEPIVIEASEEFDEEEYTEEELINEINGYD